MSRIGNKLISLPAGVTLTVEENNLVVVKGPKGELSYQFNANMGFEVNGTEVKVTRPDDSILNQEESSDEKKIIPLENLKDYVIKELSISHIVIASALIASESWDFSKEGFVQITVPSAFCLSQLQKEKAILIKSGQ